MTKTVRIENADNSNHPVRISVQYKNENGDWIDSQEKPIQIDLPTQQEALTIWKGKRLIIEEVAAD